MAGPAYGAPITGGARQQFANRCDPRGDPIDTRLCLPVVHVALWKIYNQAVKRPIGDGWTLGGDVSDFKIKDFLDRLNDLGLMLSATRLADGSIRLNQWRDINFYENEAEIKNVWMTNMAGHDTRMQDVARYLELTQSRNRSLRS